MSALLVQLSTNTYQELKQLIYFAAGDASAKAKVAQFELPSNKSSGFA
jgi:hypothetical protein